MMYSYVSLGAFWLLLLVALVLSGTGAVTGLGLLALVIAALVGPSIMLRDEGANTATDAGAAPGSSYTELPATTDRAAASVV